MRQQIWPLPAKRWVKGPNGWYSTQRTPLDLEISRIGITKMTFAEPENISYNNQHHRFTVLRG